ncbi:hypothetical protein [Marinifilum flexuosum]|uniref:Calx-beta domain-containing protein n=1 Tax=Marinifilum flexuosum TaxID=1117708 RepID=A0A419WWV5_9BACT|nr:hypothetical protein [Marinifilum flexuosum]RKD99962.1 hypothetical protein BXY64_2948 [Marinifilum flexuosum]
MKRLIIALIMILGTSSMMFAQTNTGTMPYEGSYHYYQVNGGTRVGTNTYDWKVFLDNKTAEATLGTHFVFTDASGATLGGATPTTPANTEAKIYIKWLVANTGAESYYVSIGESNDHCTTNRLLQVTVVANTFDIYAELTGTEDACATVDNPVEDKGTVGDNSDDNFGLTARNYVVKAHNLATNAVTAKTVAWNYTFTLVDKKTGTTTDEGIVLNITVDGVAKTSGSKIDIAEGTAESNISVSYTTNSNRQDEDLDLILTITSGADALGTEDADGKADSKNEVKYLVRAVPATTGITTD